MSTVYILDGSSLFYRAYYALLQSQLSTASGQPTWALVGFFNMLGLLLKRQPIDSLVIAFDRPEPTFRDTMVSDYKAGRPETPQDLIEQLVLLRQIVEELGIAFLECVGYEADDIIATVVAKAKSSNWESVVVTGDRDCFQLITDQNPSVKVLYPSKGVSDYAMLDEQGVITKTGVIPKSYPLLAALRGDTSDNLPGVPGVGAKTAAKLVSDYHSLEGIYQSLNRLPAKLGTNLALCQDQVRLNLDATILVSEVPIEVNFDDAHPRNWDLKRAQHIFKQLELNKPWGQLNNALISYTDAPNTGGSHTDSSNTAGSNIKTVNLSLTMLSMPDPVETDASLLLQSLLSNAHGIALDVAWASEPGRSNILGLAVIPYVLEDVTADPTNSPITSTKFLDALWIDKESLANEKLCCWFKTFFDNNDGKTFVIHGAKEFVKALVTVFTPGVADMMPTPRLSALWIDTAVVSYLLFQGDTAVQISELADRYLEYRYVIDVIDSTGHPPTGHPPTGSESVKRAALCALLAPLFQDELKTQEMVRLYENLERPLIAVLTNMEVVGIRVDTEYLKELNSSFVTQANQLRQEIQELAGEQFNINSVPQLRYILFDKLHLVPKAKKKTGYSTDAATLESLRGQHAIVDKLLDYREVEKLRSTYTTSLLDNVAKDGRIHATFNQTVVRTGRISSDHPNLHNIPVRTERGKKFREAFIPSEGRGFVVADYDQIELRVLAHLSQDEGLLSAFANKTDIHAQVASKVWGVPIAEVDASLRNKAKMISYGLAYGMEAYGLSQRLSADGLVVDTRDAEAILQAYFQAFPKIRTYMDSSITQAEKQGYTQTIFGRRRKIPELFSRNRSIAGAAKRQAMNAGIQGSAADIFKLALVRIESALCKGGYESRLVLQVHDEVLVDTVESERLHIEELVRDSMEHPFIEYPIEFSVPLEVNIAWGMTWGEAKG
ncbi:MAG: DNA polymerase I [Actinobacteria bacterium]|nr:DNA polymerase I [Actinomycetota bacterium]MCL6105196.1 DNA polymerase I [Actinomycetota bacterium]